MDIFGADIPFAGHCGIEPIGFADGRTTFALAPGRSTSTISASPMAG